MEPNIPNADIHNSQHNAFVQDWLTEWKTEFIPTPNDDYDVIETAIELIQSTYNYGDHEARKNAVATGGDIDATLRVLGKLMTIIPEGDEIYQHLNFAYAFVNATKQLAMKEYKTPE